MASPPQPILSVNVISFLWSPIKTWPQLLKTYSKKNPEETFFFPFKIIEKQILGESVWTTLAGESIKLSQAVWPSGVLGVVNRVTMREKWVLTSFLSSLLFLLEESKGSNLDTPVWISGPPEAP